MSSADDDLTFELAPELAPEEDQDQGFKATRIVAEDRNDMYYSKERTGFGVNVRRVYVANGFADVANGNMTKASLIIVDVWLHSTRTGHRFENMEVTFALEDAVAGASVVAPELAQFAPYKNRTSVNRSVEKQTLKTSWGGEVGASYQVDLSANYNRERKVEKEAEYFEEWQASPTEGLGGLNNGIRLSGTANESQDHNSGLFGTVRFGVLIERKAAAPWIGRFKIRTYGGFWENALSRGRRWLGLDPATTILKLSGDENFVHASKDGQAILAAVDRNQLAVYADYKKLAELVALEGAPANRA